MKRFFSFLLFTGLWAIGFSQTSFPYSISLEPLIPEGFPGLQSYAWAKDGDRVLLIGGRTDGLHRRQPFAAFQKQYNNTELIVWEIKADKVWKKPVTTLPPALAEQLQSTNMEFFQQGNQLVLVGGYGYSETKRTHITHPSLISIQVNELIDAIIHQKEISPFIRQLPDERMAVTGGRLNRLGNTLYLVGGQRFDGRYNPHGPDHGPGFSQQYTNQVRKFTLVSNQEELRIENYSTLTDSLLLHRRDYNLLAQYDEEGREMLTIYSGVFQYGKDVPFTTLVDITGDKYREVPGFHQQFSHYHTATLPLYSRRSKTMYSLFLGGIAQKYTDSEGKIVTDDNVPFIKTISLVERKGQDTKEYRLPEEMPGYFGAAAEFIPADESLFTPHGILDLDRAGKKEFLAGYIIGGIDSRAPNILWGNDPSSSRASPVIWVVKLGPVK